MESTANKWHDIAGWSVGSTILNLKGLKSEAQRSFGLNMWISIRPMITLEQQHRLPGSTRRCCSVRGVELHLCHRL